MSYLKSIKTGLLGLIIVLICGCSRGSVVLETGETRIRETSAFSETKPEELFETEDSKALIYVYVCGQVVSPGVYELAEGNRIFHAIDLAGGALPEGDIGRLNLAALLYDGQKVYVPSYEETETYAASEPSDLMNGSNETAARVNINQATKEELMQLPGIGTSKAEAIVQYRQEHGYFKSVEELMLVPGIKEGTYEQIKDRIAIN